MKLYAGSVRKSEKSALVIIWRKICEALVNSPLLGPRLASKSSTTPLTIAAVTGRPSSSLAPHWIVLNRHLRRHAAHGMNVAPVARLDQEFDVRLQEVPRHRDFRAVRQHEFLVIAELLDEAENIIPASAVKARRVVLQLIEDLV